MLLTHCFCPCTRPIPCRRSWIGYGQAFILLYLQPAGLNSLRKTGIRTIWELRAAAQALGSGLTFGAETTLDGDVPRVLAALAANPVFVRSTEIHDRMRSSPQDVASKSLPEIA